MWRLLQSPTCLEPTGDASVVCYARVFAWDRRSWSRLAGPAYADVMREVMAKHIIHLAERGERNEIKLSDSALHFFTANYKA